MCSIMSLASVLHTSPRPKEEMLSCVLWRRISLWQADDVICKLIRAGHATYNHIYSCPLGLPSARQVCHGTSYTQSTAEDPITWAAMHQLTQEQAHLSYLLRQVVCTSDRAGPAQRCFTLHAQGRASTLQRARQHLLSCTAGVHSYIASRPAVLEPPLNFRYPICAYFLDLQEHHTASCLGIEALVCYQSLRLHRMCT